MKTLNSSTADLAGSLVKMELDAYSRKPKWWQPQKFYPTLAATECSRSREKPQKNKCVNRVLWFGQRGGGQHNHVRVLVQQESKA